MSDEIELFIKWASSQCGIRYHEDRTFLYHYNTGDKKPSQLYQHFLNENGKAKQKPGPKNQLQLFQ